MEDKTPKYIVTLSDGTTGQFTEQEYNDNKDEIYKADAKAQTARINNYSFDDDIDDGALYTLGLPDGSYTVMDAKQFRDSREELRGVEGLKFSSYTPIDYHEEKFQDMSRRKNELEKELEGLPQDEMITGPNARAIHGASINQMQAEIEKKRNSPEARRRGEIKKELAELNKEIDRSPAWQARLSAMEQMADKGIGSVGSMFEELDAAHPEAAKAYKQRSFGRDAIEVAYAAKNDPDYARDQAALNSARIFYDDARKLATAPSKYGDELGISNFLKGIGAGAPTALSIAKLAKELNNIPLFDAAKQIQEKYGDDVNIQDLINETPEQLEKILSPAQMEMMKAFSLRATAEGARNGNLSMGYEAGKGFVQSLGYMADFALFGKIADIPAEAVAGEMIKNTAQGTLGRIGAETLHGLIKSIAITPMMPSTYGSILESLARFDDQGRIDLSGKEVGKAVADAFVENMSETIGAKPLELLGWGVGKAIPTDWLSNTKLGAWGKALRHTPIFNSLKQAGWNGFIEEMFEEVSGNAVRSISGIDKDALKNFMKWDQLLTTAASFAPMSLVGGIPSTARFIRTSNKVADSEEQLQRILQERGYSRDDVAKMLTEFRDMAGSPAELGGKLAQAAENAVKAGADPAEVALRFQEYANNLASYKVMEGIFEEQEDADRSARAYEISTKLGREDWNYEGDKGDRFVRTMTDANGNVFYVQSVDKTGTFLTIDPDGKAKYIYPKEIQDGVYTDSGEVAINDYLDGEVATSKKAAEQVRMENETAQKSTRLAQEAFIGRNDIPLGTEEKPSTGTILSFANGGYVVQDNLDGSIHTFTPQEMANRMGIDLSVKTDAELNEEAAKEDEHLAGLRVKVNDAVEKATQVGGINLDGLSESIPQGSTAFHVSRSDNGEYQLIYRDTEGNFQSAPIGQAELDELSRRADELQIPETPPAEAPVEADKDPLRIDELPEDMSPEAETDLFNESPERWAAWNDRKRQDGGANSRAYLELGVKTQEKKLAELEKQYASEGGIAERRALEDAISTTRDRIQTLADAIAKREAQIAKEVAAEAENAEPVEGVPAMGNAIPAEQKQGELGPEYQVNGQLTPEQQAEEQRRVPLRDRAHMWEQKTGVKVVLLESADQVENPVAKREIEREERLRSKKQRVTGWYEERTVDGQKVGTVYLYLPNIVDEAEIDKTYIHEVISHKGLKEMLQDKWVPFLDQVWNDLMDEANRKKYTDYVLATNPNATGADLQRAAADEFVAFFSENLDLEENQGLWDKFVNMVRDFLMQMMGEENFRMTEADLSNLLRASLARYKEIAENGEAVSPLYKSGEMTAEERLNNEGVAIDEERGDARFSVRYAPKESEINQIAEDISQKTGVSKAVAKRWVMSEMSLAPIIGQKENRPYLDYKGDDRFTAIKENSDYPQGTVDFNNICRKRIAFTNMYQRIQKAFPNVIITGEDLANIRNIMKAHGIEVACGLCYVEDRRQLLGEIAKDFIDNYYGNFEDYASRGGETKKKNADKFRSLIGEDRKDDLSIYDLITLDGSSQLYEEHPGIYEAFQAFNNARGQQAGNLFQGYAEYKREILKWTKSHVKSVNDNGGLRIFSYSDFEAHHLIDLVQIIQDCARMGIKIQGYTKVPAFARAVAKTGIKLNRSLIPLGDTGIVDGKLAYDSVEGIDINDPDFLESNDNIGNILIGINDEQIRLAMADPFIHFIIPYHSNQKEILRQLKRTGAWTNYKDSQNEKTADGKRAKENVNIYTEVIAAAEAEGNPITSERQFTEKFLEVCRQKGLTPRFEQFLDRVGGKYVYTPGYYKLLVDFKMFDENGNYLPQNAVVAEFDDAFNKQILDGYVAGEQEKFGENLDGVYDEIVQALSLESRVPDVQTPAEAEETAEAEAPALREDTITALRKVGIDLGDVAGEQMTSAEAEEIQTSFRAVTDLMKIAELEAGPKVSKIYRSAQAIEDSNGEWEYDFGDGRGPVKVSLYAPMSAKVDGKWRNPIRPNEWEEAEERPDLANEKGEFKLNKGNGKGMWVAYAPYLHHRRSPLNEQFSEAWNRPNLVILEVEIPESELTSNYTAEKSKKSTGEHDWASGKVSNALARRGMNTRKVILSRWSKPTRLVPAAEVADEIVNLMGDKKLTFQNNVVTPSLRRELVSRGVKFSGWQGKKPDNVEEIIARMKAEDEKPNTKFRTVSNEELFDMAKERFGTTRDIREAGYVLPDGTMLDFSGRHLASGDTSYLDGNRQVDHRDIADLNYERDLNTPSGIETDMQDFIKRGAIRIDSSGSINLAIKPTDEQIPSLRRLVEMNNGNVYIDFGDGWDVITSAWYEGAKSDRVINEINRYFNEGVQPQGNSLRFAIRGILGAQNAGDQAALDNLEIAKEMEQANKDAASIWMATGWEKGADGKWRNEIPDVALKEGVSLEEYNTAQDIIDAPEFFKSYPELLFTTIQLVNSASAGAYNAEDNRITIDRGYNTKQKDGRTVLNPEGNRTLVHEFQHAIQHLEGFARGGSERMMEKEYYLDTAKKSVEKAIFAWHISRRNSAAKLMRVGKDRVTHFVENFDTTRLNDQDKDAFAQMLNYLKGINEDEYRTFVRSAATVVRNANKAGEMGYRNLAGEVEARNAETRSAVSPEARRMRPISSSESVPRADQIIRFRVNSEQKQAENPYAETVTDVDIAEATMFRLSKNNRNTIETWLNKRSDISEEERNGVINYLDSLEDAKTQLAAAKWFANGKIRLPEDMPKVEQAVSVAGKAKVDPLTYDSPMALLDAHADFKPTEKRIDPDTVKTLHKAAEYPEGIVIYDVDEGEESRKNMREIINTHFGKDASPWCLLQGDGEGNLTEDSKKYWKHYNAYPKQVAFKDGKLLAFSANDSFTKVWWDRQDRSHFGVPITKKIDGDELGRSVAHILYDQAIADKDNLERELANKYNCPPYRLRELASEEDIARLDEVQQRINENYQNGKPLTFIPEPGAHPFRGNRQNGVYEEWGADGETLLERGTYKDGKLDGLHETWFHNGQQESKITYKDDHYVGHVTYWFDNGQVRLESELDEKSRKHGPSKSWYKNGNKRFEGSYNHGDFVGEQKEWDEDGDLRRVQKYGEAGDFLGYEEHGHFGIEKRVTYTEGGRVEETFYRSGVLASRQNFGNDGLEGLQEYFYTDGSIQERANYHQDVRHGLRERYNADGQLIMRGNYNLGRRNGVFERWSRDGELTDRAVFRDDTVVEGPDTSYLRFRIANENQEIFVSNAAKAVEGIQNEKATPEQWLKQLEKNGGLKAGEDKWIGLSDWLKASQKKTLTKQEVLDYINEHRIQIEETHYKEGATQHPYKQIYNSAEYDTLNKRFKKLVEEDIEELGVSMEESCEVNFENLCYEIEQEQGKEKANLFYDGMDYDSEAGVLSVRYDDNGEPVQAALDFFGIERDDSNYINTTRLLYTTSGLKDRHEIALTVPTIEPWNESDSIHFGDAGEGRAIAWIRFGDTTVSGDKRVLVIDEIQSKRHQEGREKGYMSDTDVTVKYDSELNGWNYYFKGEHRGYMNKLIAPTEEEALRLAKSYYKKGVPAAPFEKNWHELAMKRMLRYAAENGYDAIAWTTGDQQADRYNLGNVLDSVYIRDEKWGREAELLVKQGGTITLKLDENGTIRESNYDEYKGKDLKEVVGKELASKIMSAENGDEISGDGLRIGAEGMQGFYDDILPRFMNKYGKKWGVSVKDMELPIGEDGKEVMHSVEVTPEMKESVMEGQTMFRSAYHGSGAEFDSFDSSHMGEGEGHQAHGWGHYVSLSQDTANRYSYLGERDKVVYNGKEAPTYYAGELVQFAIQEMAKGRSFDEVKTSLLDMLNKAEENRKARNDSYWRNYSNAREIEFIEGWGEEDFTVNEVHRNLYTVDIPEDTGENYITEDRNLRKPVRLKIAEALRSLPEDAWSVTEDMAMLYRDKTAGQLADKVEKGPINGGDLYAELTHGLGSKKAASEFLSNAGFVGIKYEGSLDGPSAVIFRDEDMTIVNHTRFRAVSPVTYKQSEAGIRESGEQAAQKLGIEMEISPKDYRDANDAAKAAIHQAIGQKGLRQVLGDDNMRRLNMDLFRSLPQEAREAIADTAIGRNGGNISTTVEQYLADRAEDLGDGRRTAERELWGIVRDNLQQALSSIGIDVNLNEGDARWIMWQSHNAGRQGDMLNEVKRQVIANRLGFSRRAQERKHEGMNITRFRSVEDIRTDQAARAYNFAVNNVWKRLREAFVDQYQAVNELVKAIEKATGKVASSFEDIRIALNQQGSKALAKMNEWITKFNTPMWEAIKDVMKAGEYTLKEVERYVMIKHGLERNEVFAKRDARELCQAMHDKAVKEIQSSDKTAEEKDALIKKEDERLERHMRKIEDGTDKYYLEFRERDYGGLTGLYSDFDEIERQGKLETDEEYAIRQKAARHPRYTKIVDGKEVVDMEAMEEAARLEVELFEKYADGKTDALWDRINAATKETLKQQYEANIISREQYKHVRDMFKFYVPLRGFEDTTAENLYDYYNSDQRQVFTAPLQRAKGRKTQAESPFGFIAAAASSGIAQNMKNESKLALYYFVANRKDNGVVSVSETWFEKVGEDDEGKAIFEPSFPPFVENLSTEEAKERFREWERGMQEKAAAGLAYKGTKKLDLQNVVVHINPRHEADHVISFKLGGKDMFMYVNGNPRAAQAINNELNYNAEDSILTDTLNQVLRTMAALNTQLNPEFWISNFQRDVLFALMSVNTKEGGDYTRNFRHNLIEARKVVKMKKALEKGTLGDSYDEQLYREFVENGGVTGYTVIYDNEYWEKRLDEYAGKDKNALSSALDALKGISEFGEAIEQLTRFAAFKTSREAGKDIMQSIADAKELTVNFNRKGSGKAISLEEAARLTWSNGKKLNKAEQIMVSFISNLSPYGRRFIMFFNASIQGLNAMVQLFKKNPTRAATWCGGYLAVGMMNAILHALFDDDDDYLDIPDWERRNNMLLGIKNAYLKWALPQEARVFYGLGDMIVNHAMGRTPNKNIVGELLSSLGEVAPIDFPSGIGAFVPSAATPIVEVIRNEDYKGARVYNEHKYYTEEQRRNVPAYRDPLANTGGFYVGLSKVLNAISGGDDYSAGAINLNPNIVEHLVEGYTGGTGTSVEKMLQFFGDVTRGEIVARNTPFLRRMVSINDERYRNTHTTDLYYYYQDEAASIRRQIKEAAKNGDDRKLDKLYADKRYEQMLIFDSYEGQLKYYNEALKLTDDESERRALMREQDAVRKQMIQEISNIGKQ